MKFPVPDKFKPFMSYVKRKCKAYGIELILSPSETVVLTDDLTQNCSGYFCDVDKALVVACGRPFDKWGKILVHEYCHMEQWKTDSRWKEWGENTLKAWDWLAGDLMMNKTQIANVMDSMVELEKDCEIRALEMIRKYDLPIQRKRYIKAANVYLYSYHMLPKLKRFPTGIYEDEYLIDLAPERFQKSYRDVPKDMEKHMIQMYSKKS